MAKTSEQSIFLSTWQHLPQINTVFCFHIKLHKMIKIMIRKNNDALWLQDILYNLTKYIIDKI